MYNDLHNRNSVLMSEKYENLKIENNRLLFQNSKLIKKLEEITFEFSKSQTKLKDFESISANQISVSGNLNQLSDRIKLLESDNRQLCEELKKQIKFDIFQNSNSQEINETITKQLLNLKSDKSNSQEKIINLKNHIRELQTQLVKTQEIAFANECNYKECQIETLEALKACEIEKNSLSNQITNLEEMAKNVVLLHKENFELKTALNRHSTDMESLKDHCLKLTDKISKSEQSSKEFDREIKNATHQLELSQKKVANLISENQCLLSTLEQLTLSANTTSADQVDDGGCKLCQDGSTLAVSVQQELQQVTKEMNIFKQEKEDLNERFQEQAKNIIRFEEEQNILRSELDNLHKNETKYEILFKSKHDEIDNLNCQLSSVQQRLELRDQRVNEVSCQLSKSVAEEKLLVSQISKLSEKINNLEESLRVQQNDISTREKENLVLRGKLEQFKRVSSSNEQEIKDLKLQLQQAVVTNSDVMKSLDNTNSAHNIKTREFEAKIASLTESMEQLSYSIKIYENENKKLEDNLQLVCEELQTLRSTGQLEGETYRLERDRTQIQLDKDQEIIKVHLSNIEHMTSEIEVLRGNKSELERALMEKIKEMEISVYQHQIIETELTETKLELDRIKIGVHRFDEQSLLNQKLKIELDCKMKENKKLKHCLSEVNLRLDVLNRTLVEEKDRSRKEESRCRDLSGQLEALQFKYNFVDDELNCNRNRNKELEETQKTELKHSHDKLYCVEKERDDAFARLCALEIVNNRHERDCENYQCQIRELQNHNMLQEGELLSRKQLIDSLETQISSLQDHVRCSQITLVERSRDIDRLEQLVRDRTEQIELRSSQLQTFQVDLEKKLTTMQYEVEEGKMRESESNSERKNIKTLYDELLIKYNDQEKIVTEMLKEKNGQEQEVVAVRLRVKQLENENQTLDQDIRLLKEELTSKLMVVKNLLQRISCNDKEIEILTEKLESKKSVLAAKELQIKQMNDKTRNNLQKFTEIETKLKADLKATSRKLQSSEEEFRKSVEKLEKKYKLEHEKYQDELSVKTGNVKRLNEELELMSEQLLNTQENFANLKMEIETHKSVLMDTENNCRLKGVVIERLLKKLNVESLETYKEQISDISTIGDFNCKEINNKTNCAAIYEDVSLQELINRISKKLESD